MKNYCVAYDVTTGYDTVVKAKNAQEAIAKVREVVGDPLIILSVYEQKEKEND